jgi:hypothetical protein
MRGKNIMQRYGPVLCMAVAAGLFLASPVTAGTSRDMGEGGAGFSTEEVQAFAKAQVKVTQIQTSIAKDLGAAKVNPNVPVGKLPREIKQPTVQAIQEHGLTVETYDRMLEAYKADEDLRKEVVRATINLYP